jgi:regulatory protein
MRQRLLKYAPAEEVEGIINRLLALKLLDDLNFSVSFASYRLRELHQGPLRIRGELMQRGVKEETIARALETATAEMSVEESARRAAEKMLKKRSSRLTLKEYKRVLGRLSRAGFPSDAVRKALRSLGADDIDWAMD